MLPSLRRRLSPLLMAALALLPLGAQAETERGLIYRIGGDPASYLVGSIHVGNPSLYPLPSAMQTAYDKADALVVEADIIGVDRSAMIQMLTEHGMYGGGRNLEGALSKSEWRAVSDAAERYGVPLAMLQPQKPWLALQTLTVLAVQAEGYSESLGIDRRYLEKAHDTGKRIVELEGIERQLEILSQMPEDQQKAMLTHTAEEIADGEVPMAEMVEAWKTGQPEALQSQIREQFPPALQDGYQHLIVDRNHNMARRIDGLLAEGDSLFIVVGAAHLTGPDGLVNLLRDRGHELEQM